MTIKKGFKNRAKMFFIRLVVVVALLVIGANIPAFAEAEVEIKDNCMTVVRENMYQTSVDVIVNEIDAKGNIEEKKVKVNFEEGVTEFSFDQEYFKEILETENDVYLVETSDRVFDIFAYYTTGVGTAYVIWFFVTLLAGWYWVVSLVGFCFKA